MKFKYSTLVAFPCATLASSTVDGSDRQSGVCSASSKCTAMAAAAIEYNSFDSVNVADGTFFQGTDCYIYSDYNCQYQVADTGNQEGSKCVNVPGAQSMRCFEGC
jgi:hypothetical protein